MNIKITDMIKPNKNYKLIQEIQRDMDNKHVYSIKDYRYNNKGNIFLEDNDNGLYVVKHEYDDLDRKIKTTKDYGKDSTKCGNNEVLYEYDRKNRLIKSIFDNGYIIYEYNENDKIIKQTTLTKDEAYVSHLNFIYNNRNILINIYKYETTCQILNEGVLFIYDNNMKICSYVDTITNRKIVDLEYDNNENLLIQKFYGQGNSTPSITEYIYECIKKRNIHDLIGSI